MQTLRILLPLVVLCVTAGTAAADLTKQIVGTWVHEYTIVDTNRKSQIVYEFTKDGQVIVGLGTVTIKGTYRVIDPQTIETEINDISSQSAKKRVHRATIIIKSGEMTMTDLTSGAALTLKKK